MGSRISSSLCSAGVSLGFSSGSSERFEGLGSRSRLRASSPSHATLTFLVFPLSYFTTILAVFTLHLTSRCYNSSLWDQAALRRSSFSHEVRS